MATTRSPLLTTLRCDVLKCAVAVIGLPLLAGCWDTIPYSGSVESSVDSPIPAKTSGQQSATPSTEPTAPPISDPFLDEDIFADTSSMFDTGALDGTSAEPDAVDSEPSSTHSISSNEPIAEEEERVFTPLRLQNKSQSTSQNTRQKVWKLGSALCMAVTHFSPLPDSTSKEEAKQAALELLIVLPELQEESLATATEFSAQEAMETLLPLGRQIGKQIFTVYDREHVALFEVGFKSSMLLVLYAPDSPMNNAMASTIESGAAKAKLPPRLWQPLVDAIEAQQPRETIEKEVFNLHKAAFDFLAD